MSTGSDKTKFFDSVILKAIDPDDDFWLFPQWKRLLIFQGLKVIFMIPQYVYAW